MPGTISWKPWTPEHLDPRSPDWYTVRMSTYELADPTIHKLVIGLRNKHHKDLTDEKVTIAVLMVHAPRDQEGEPKGYAITDSGYPVFSKLAITSRKDRALGLADVQLQLDADRWEKLHDRTKLATIDHELEKIELVRDDEGAVKTDDQTRPRTKIKRYDVRVGWFHAVATRHGEYSLEIIQAREIVNGEGQLFFPFSEVKAA